MDSQETTTSPQEGATTGTNESSDNAALSRPASVHGAAEIANFSTEQLSQAPETEAPSNPRLQALAAKKANLEAALASLQAQRSALVAATKLPSGLAMPDTWTEDEKTKSALASSNGVIKEHIALLHKYNEIKDIGQGLMGLIADKRGVRVATVMEDYGMDERD